VWGKSEGGEIDGGREKVGGGGGGGECMGELVWEEGGGCGVGRVRGSGAKEW